MVGDGNYQDIEHEIFLDKHNLHILNKNENSENDDSQ